MNETSKTINNALNNGYYLSIVFVLLSASSYLIYGLDLWSYITYNMDMSDYLNHKELYIDNKRFEVFFIKWFSTVFDSILIKPFYFILFGLILKALLLFLIYRISNIFIKNNIFALSATVLFVFSASYATHGEIQNGIWGSPIFYRTGISTFFLLTGFFYLFKDKYLSSAILLSIAVHFHPINAITTIIFLIPVVIIEIYQDYSINKGKLPIKKIGFFVILLLNSLLILFSISSWSGGIENDIVQSIQTQDWFNYVSLIDPGDVSLFMTIKEYGFSLMPLILFGIYASNNIPTNNDKNLKKLKYSFFTGIAIFALSGLFELLHFNGIFFGYLSDMHIVLQMRRGLWITLFLSLLLIVIWFKNYSNRLNNKYDVILSLLCLSTYLYAKYITVVIALILLFIRTKYKPILFILLLVIWQWIDVSLDDSLLNYLIPLFVMIVVTLTTMFLFKVLKKYNFVDILNAEFILFVAPLIFFISINILGSYKNDLFRDVALLTKDGWFNNPSNVSVITGHYSQKKYDYKVVNYIRNSKLDGLMLIPISDLQYSDRQLYRRDVFFSSFDISMPMFYKNGYGVTQEKLATLFGKDLVRSFFSSGEFNKISTIKYLDSLYSSISIDKLKKLHESKNIRFFLSKENIKNLDPILIGDKYFLYDLSFI